MNLRTALHILQLDSQATRGDVKQAYRKLASQWHPDLHAHNPKSAPKAAKKMQEINNAYTFALSCVGTRPPEIAKSYTSSPTVRFNTRLSLFLLAVSSCLTLVALLFFLYKSHSTDQKGSFSANQTHFTLADKHRLLFKADDFHQFQQSVLKKAQANLATIGYPTGKIDGIFGPQSLAAIQSFRTDFSILNTPETAEEMLRILAAHGQLATAHPEWRSIVQSEHFHSWLAKRNIGTQKQQIHFSTTPQLTQLFNLYTFTTITPAVQPLPLTALLWHKAPYATTKSITIVGKEAPRQHSFIKLIAADSEQELMYAFIRQGEHLIFPCPAKKCLLKVATGKQWYGKRFLFGPETKYGTVTVDHSNTVQNITLPLSSTVSSKGLTTESSVYNF